jgi:hypothetical protein
MWERADVGAGLPANYSLASKLPQARSSSLASKLLQATAVRLQASSYSSFPTLHLLY